MTRKSNDGGKDIILYKNNCNYLVECRRFKTNNNVGREYLQKFYAAICEENADLGFFVTTSDFTKDAYDYVSNWCKKIQLINGKKLVEIINKSNLAVINTISLNLHCEKCAKPICFKNLSSLSDICENGHSMQNPIYGLIKEYERAI